MLAFFKLEIFGKIKIKNSFNSSNSWLIIIPSVKAQVFLIVTNNRRNPLDNPYLQGESLCYSRVNP